MICVKCGKEIAQPLELYDGSWVCPSCFKDLIGVDQEFVINEENESLYRTSEINYYTWLENADGEATLALVEEAVSLCKQAAYMGNPMALLRLGYYYDKDYDEINRSESMRCRFAYKCYKSVALALSPPKVLEGAQAIDFIELQKRASVMLFDMMKSAPDDMRRAVAVDFERTRKVLSAKFGIEYYGSFDGEKSGQSGRLARLNELVSSLKNNHRAPIFGVIRVTASDIQKMFDPKGREKAQVSLLSVIKKKKTDVFLVKLNDKGAIDEKDDGIYKLTTESQVSQLLALYDLSQPLALVIVNGLGKHPYLNGVEDDISDALRKKDGFLIHRLLSDADRTQTEFVFYDDDLYYFARGQKRKTAHALEKLIDSVCEGGKD